MNIAKSLTGSLIAGLGLLVASAWLQAQFGTSTQIFPHFAVDGGSATFFDVHNPGTQEITVTAELFNTDGTQRETRSEMVPAGGSATLAFGGPSGTAASGWARLSSDGPFTASEFFQLGDAQGQLVSQVGVLPSRPATQIKFFGAFRGSTLTRTGFAMANPSASKSSNVTVRLVERDGTERASQMTVLGPGEQTARFLEEAPFFVGLQDFEGVVEITADEPVAAVTLRSDNNLLATVSVTEPGLPIRGEFPEDGVPNLIGGDEANSVTDGVQGATIGGGGEANFLNKVTDDFGTVGGGRGNQAGDDDSFTTDAPYVTVGGGVNNTASGFISTVGGGDGNTASRNYSTVGGGDGNTASHDHSTVGGGEQNTASGLLSTVGGGSGNEASGSYDTVGGGISNTAGPALGATVGGGFGNTASGRESTVSGGGGNTASGEYSTVSGGRSNEASGDYSFAAGRRAKVVCQGCFMWADSNDVDFLGSPGLAVGLHNQFLARATGGFRFVTGIDGSGVETSGVRVGIGGGSWSSLSAREAKENFAPTDGRQVLERLVSVPITTWSYKAQQGKFRHIGPAAQDFYAAFEVGEDERHIATVDADGVALAAIQGLYQIVQEKETLISTLNKRLKMQEAENLEVKARLAKIEELIRKR